MKYFYSKHAIYRMFERDISEIEIEDTIKNGIVIAEYPDDNPYPSKLNYSNNSENPLHVVYSEYGEKCIIITVYKPSLDEWKEDYMTRRSKE